jgi:hypothetical protein
VACIHMDYNFKNITLRDRDEVHYALAKLLVSVCKVT